MNTLEPSIESAARAFLSAIENLYPINAAFLFGSRARGDHDADSDADLAIILSGVHGSTVNTMLEMIGAAYQIELERGIVLSPLPIWQDQWDQPERFSNPALLRNIKRDGVAL